MIKVFVLNFSKCSGLSVRSAFWMGEKILVGTNSGEVFEVIATEKDKPKTIVQVGIKISVRMSFLHAFKSLQIQTSFSYVRVMLKENCGLWLCTQRSQCLLQAVMTEVLGISIVY